MKIYQNELSVWKLEQEWFEHQKVYGVKRNLKDPNKEKQYEFLLKQKRYIHWYKKEHSWVKQKYQKKFHQKWNQERNRGEWHRPINKEYHTYGYLTW